MAQSNKHTMRGGLTFHFMLLGGGLDLRILSHDFDSQRLILFSFSLIRRFEVWRGETWYWLNEYGHASLSFQRKCNGKTSESWSLSGPFVRVEHNI